MKEPSTKGKLKQVILKTVKLNIIGMKADAPYNDFIGTVAAKYTTSKDQSVKIALNLV